MSWSDPSVITNIVLVGITFLYLIATVLIWHATWQNTKATRQVLEGSHRPYVGVTQMWLGTDDLTGDWLLLTKIANVGSIPARHIEVELQIHMQGRQLLDSRHVGVGSRQQVALLPSQMFVSKVPLPQEQVASMQTSPECRAQISIDYGGMSDKKYRTNGTYTYTGDVEFVIASASFE